MAVPPSDRHEHCLRSLEGHAEPREELLHRPVVRHKEPLAIEGQREVAVSHLASDAPRLLPPSPRGPGKPVPRAPPPEGARPGRGQEVPRPKSGARWERPPDSG